MRLSDYIKDVGRMIAYYPNLKQVTGSTTASILLCQLLYWTDKTKDGWIYKTHYEIEDETGLSYNEQKTARAKLVEIGVMEEEFKRWDRTNRYRVNRDVLNNLWELSQGRVVEPVEAEVDEVEETVDEEEKPIPVNLVDFQNPALHAEHPAHKSAVKKQGDYIDMLLNDPGVKKENIKNEIREKIESKLRINISGTKWNSFVDYVYTRQETYKEPVDRFIEWAKKEKEDGIKTVYWTPEKLMMLYPQAFEEDKKNKPREDFVQKPPEHKEDDSIPMPDYVKTKKKQY
jgi:hypothetical protein